VVHTHPFSRSAHTGENFVGKQEDPPLIAEGTQFGKKIVGRKDGTPPTLASSTLI